MFKVEIKNLETKARIGITSKERKKYQKLLVTIGFNYKVNKKNKLDDIKYLKNYSKIIKFLKIFILNSEYKSLERLVDELSLVIQKKFKIRKVFVSINKIEVAKRFKCESISVSK
tara:strand:- start:105 stop:449 length:345 start_codon:yes stop_codon:yes gene_type:complete